MENKNYYEDIPDDQFVPLECVDSVFIGKYKINKLGEVKTVESGKIRSNFKSYSGKYPNVSLRSGKSKKGYAIHVLVAKTFIPNPENKTEVDHIDKNILNYKKN